MPFEPPQTIDLFRSSLAILTRNCVLAQTPPVTVQESNVGCSAGDQGRSAFLSRALRSDAFLAVVRAVFISNHIVVDLLHISFPRLVIRVARVQNGRADLPSGRRLQQPLAESNASVLGGPKRESTRRPGVDGSSIRS